MYSLAAAVLAWLDILPSGSTKLRASLIEIPVPTALPLGLNLPDGSRSLSLNAEPAPPTPGA